MNLRSNVRLIWLAGAIGACAAAACGGTAVEEPRVATIKDGNSVASYPGGGGVLISNTRYEKNHGNKEVEKKVICVAPPPQAALIGKTKGGANAKVGVTEAVDTDLAGSLESERSAMVLYEFHDSSILLQHALYRLCEATSNGQIGQEHYGTALLSRAMDLQALALQRALKANSLAASIVDAAKRVEKREADKRACEATAAARKTATKVKPNEVTAVSADDCEAEVKALESARKDHSLVIAAVDNEKALTEAQTKSIDATIAAAKEALARGPADAGQSEFLSAMDRILTASLLMADRDVAREEARAARAKAEAAKAETESKAPKLQAKVDALEKQIDELHALAMSRLLGTPPAAASDAGADAGGKH